jgi:SAM-dependent methyltransferase
MSRLELRKTFGEDAELYDRVRPSYPSALYDDLAELVGPPLPRVLEIGCGTGQATAPMVARGWPVTAVELSPDLAAVARRNVPRAEVVTAAFESWPLPAERFDLVLSATAFHWIDPEVRVVKSADALRPGGVLAVVSTHHVDCSASRALYEQVQGCYERYMPDAKKGERPPVADAVPDDPAEFDASGRFGPVRFRRYEWHQEYTIAQYLDLLSSYSGHRAMPADARRALYSCISGHVERAGGRIAKGYLTQLSAAVVRD